jgi:hypothetical protein
VPAGGSARTPLHPLPLSLPGGQFLTHDLDFATPLADFNSDANFVIPIPRGDPWFDPEGTGAWCIALVHMPSR